MTKATLNALIGIRDNLNIIIDELAQPVCSCPNGVSDTTDTPTTATGKKSSRKEKEASEKIPASDEITAESLNGMSYNNLKKLAKSLGVSATGARDEIIERILNAGSVPTAEEPAPDDEDEETSEVEETEDDSETEDDDSDDENDSDDEDDSEEEETEEERIVRQVNEAVEDMSNEEIMDVLTDAGIKAKGKRQALIDAVVKAVMNGDLSLGDDDEDDPDDSDDSDNSDDEDGGEEFDPNDTSNPAMTKKRRKAIEEFAEDTRHDFKSKSLTRKEIVEWLNEFYGTKDTMKKKSDDELLEEYIHCSCLLIDDDGEMPEEEGAYLVNDVPYCCGRPLKLVDNTYVCEFCGGEYDAEDEE